MDEYDGLDAYDIADILEEEQYAAEYYKRLQDEEDALIEYVERYVERNGRWRC